MNARYNPKTGLPLYVTQWRDRMGKLRLRFRDPRGDRRTVYISDPFPSDAFWATYHRLLAETQAGAPTGAPAKGTVGDLVARFLQRPAWAQNADTYRKPCERQLAKVVANIGDEPARRVTLSYAEAILAKYADRPSVHNRLRKLMREVWDLGKRHGLVRDNPWADTQPLSEQGEGYYTWTDRDVELFEAKWAVGTRERLAFALLLYTGQRGGDVRRMGPGHLRGGFLDIVQHKTGTPVAIPVLPALQSILAATETGKETFLVDSHGDPMSDAAWSRFFRKACEAAGVHPEARAHGLRKAMLTRLAEQGATQQQIKAISGHKNDAEVAVYVARANQRRLAMSAMGLGDNHLALAG